MRPFDRRQGHAAHNRETRGLPDPRLDARRRRFTRPGSGSRGYAGSAWSNLVLLGVREWRARPVDLTLTKPEPKSARAIYAGAVLISLTNPKTLLFYGAFFPQFIRPGHDIGTQVAVLSGTFLILAILIDGTWAISAARVRRLLGSHGRLRNRLSGGLLVGAGVGLAMARVKP